MGTFLKVAGALALVVGAGIVALLFWSHGAGEDAQRGFYEAVGSGDPDRLLARFDPEMLELVEPGPLKVWMDSVATHLGAFKELSGSNFSTSKETQNGRSVVKSEGKVIFEKGEGQSLLTLLDDKVVRFELRSDKLPDPWMDHAPEAAPYVERAVAFAGHLLAGRIAEAQALMFEALRAQVPDEELAQGMAELRAGLGADPRITAGEPAFTGGKTPTLRIPIEVHGEGRRAEGHVTFQFTPWKGLLTAYRLRPAAN